MATRGAIARLNGVGRFRGVYHHWDSYPTGLGKTLFQVYQGHFGRDLDAMLRYLINDHPAGWSTINHTDFSLPAGYSEVGYLNGPCRVCGRVFDDHRETLEEFEARRASDPTAVDNRQVLGHAFEAVQPGPRCFCHGERSEEAQVIHERSAAGAGVEWVYAFDTDTRHMVILSSYSDSGSKMLGAFGFGDTNAHWRIVADVDLDGAEPDWETVTCGENLETCTHTVTQHFPELEELGPESGKNLSVQTYLGRTEMTHYDVYAVRIGEKTYRLTGGGYSSNYSHALTPNRWRGGPPSWIASMENVENPSEKIDHPFALTGGETYRPYPGVTWLYPATQQTPAYEVTGTEPERSSPRRTRPAPSAPAPRNSRRAPLAEQLDLI